MLLKVVVLLKKLGSTLAEIAVESVIDALVDRISESF